MHQLSADTRLDGMAKETEGARKPSLEAGTSMNILIDPVKEKRMMRKFDVNIQLQLFTINLLTAVKLYALLFIGVLYMFCNLDRGNVGNANIAGMGKDIGLVGNQFGTAVTLLYATYVPFEAPIAILLKIVGPKPLLAICATSWGCVTIGMGFVQNWQGLYACRLLLGLFEAGLIPCLETYLGLVYKRDERGTRMVMVYSWSAISSAFGGLLAFGLTQINGPHGFAGWRWLFIVEGILTLSVIPFFLWLFPKDILDAWFLTEEEKEMMRLRYSQNPSWGIDEKFTWGELLKAATDPKFFAFFVILFCGDLTIYGFTTFLPSILHGMGYTSVHANLLTVPVYIWALLVFIVAGLSSDRFGNRSIPIAGGFICMIIGYAILISVESVGVRYLLELYGRDELTVLVAMGIYPTVALLIMWLTDNVARHFKRASMIGFTLTLANTSGVVTGQIFTATSAPRYIKGLSIAMGLAALGLSLVGVLCVSFKLINRRRASKIAKAEQDGRPLPSRPEQGDYDIWYLRKLEREVESLRNQRASSPRLTQRHSEAPGHHPLAGAADSPALENPLVTQCPRLLHAEHSARPMYLGDASGVAFGMKLRQLIGAGEPASLRNQHKYFRDPTLLRMSNPSFRLPEKSYAMVLISLVKRFLGNTHHLYMGEAFTERLNNLYATQSEDPLWVCRLYLVFALGDLYSNTTMRPSTEHDTPGTSFFLTAMSLFQDVYEEASILFVETLMLASIFSDALNRSNSAYAFIGLALRVSLTLGLHRNINGLPAVEREHRVRVWWTVHYLERLCSSKLGHPMMLRDEDISTAPPSWDGLSEVEKAEFPPPAILVAQLGLARIVGFISRDLYVVSRQEPNHSFLHSVHSIFTSLKSWNECLPDELRMEPPKQGCRSISSLHLLFNQCVILATRPVLFLVFQHRRATSDHPTSSEAGENHIPAVATALADNCVRAARNINSIITHLWIDGSIAMFGYTDALIIFTSTMVLMLSVSLGLSNTTEDRDKMETAWRLLSSMGTGNKAAREFCEHLVLLRQDLGLGVFHVELADADDTDEQRSQQVADDPEEPLQLTASPSVSGQLLDNGLDSALGMRIRSHDQSLDDRTWQIEGDTALPASFYVRADSVNTVQAILAQQQSSNTTATGAFLPAWGSQIYHRYDSRQDGYVSAADLTAEDGNQSETTVLLNDMGFGIGMADMCDEEIGTMPFLWE
ncbi:hypothetical protein G7046_g8859 [Stylonectria norvegica]|nr:hypothetical protein G7046_g8859 [Stylonectria norvegica]